MSCHWPNAVELFLPANHIPIFATSIISALERHPLKFPHINPKAETVFNPLTLYLASLLARFSFHRVLTEFGHLLC
jgi:hypothetical protein